MDPNSRLLMLGSGGSAPVERVYVEDVFSTHLYTGNGSTQTITNGIDLAGEGGLLWLKKRDNAAGHYLADTNRGNTKTLRSDSSGAESTNAVPINSFNSNGFTIGADSEINSILGHKMTSWTFRKAPGFFDVVTYTGNGANRTIAHNLGSVPGCIITKRLDSTSSWFVYHRSRGATLAADLSTSGGFLGASNVYNNTAPTSSVFTVGTNTNINASGGTYVAYLFAHDAAVFGENSDQSIIKCDSVTVTAGTWSEVNLGWEPQFVLFKNATVTGTSNGSPGTGSADWHLIDNMRGMGASGLPNTNNVSGTQDLSPNLSAAEYSNVWFGLTPKGFAFKGLASGSDTFIYIAIRRGPMKTPTSGTDVFSSIATVSNTTNVQQAGFPVDLVLAKQRTGTNPPTLATRLLGGSYLTTNSTSAEVAWSYVFFDSNIGYRVSTAGTYFNASSTTNLFFRRAPGFFDVVAYTGTGANRSLNHNLAVIPELMIAKKRSGADNWPVYSAALGTGVAAGLQLNTADSAGYNNGTRFYQTPTASLFYVGTDTDINTSGQTYITYLFATLPGISKVGSYTGTGTTLNIDCGFTSGARFVLIKRTDSTGDWYVWDTARGIVSGNDPYLLLNSTAAEVTSTDYIDPLSSGFQISSSAPAAINASGGSFIFLAVA